MTLTRGLTMTCCNICVVTVLLLASSNASAHSGQLNIKALDACKLKERSQACEYQGVHNDLYIGTCQYMADTLTCVRNQPIQKLDNDPPEYPFEHLQDDTQKKAINE
jgi:hypothetical protein